MANISGGVKRRIFWICIGLAAVILAGGSIYLFGQTLVAFWPVLLGATAVAAASGSVMWRLWRGATADDRFLPNFLCHTVAATIVVIFLVLFVNYRFRDRATAHEVKAVVARVYYKERQRTRRSGRHYVATGEKYKEYYLEAVFPGGRSKEVPLTFSQYRRTAKGDTLTCSVSRGLLRIPVLDTPASPAHSTK